MYGRKADTKPRVLLQEGLARGHLGAKEDFEEAAQHEALGHRSRDTRLYHVANGASTFANESEVEPKDDIFLLQFSRDPEVFHTRLEEGLALESSVRVRSYDHGSFIPMVCCKFSRSAGSSCQRDVAEMVIIARGRMGARNFDAGTSTTTIGVLPKRNAAKCMPWAKMMGTIVVHERFLTILESQGW